MTKSERVLAAAHEYGESYFYPNPLSAVEIAGSGISLGGGAESWLVRVECRRQVIVAAIVLFTDGTTEVTHHTRSAA